MKPEQRELERSPRGGAEQIVACISGKRLASFIREDGDTKLACGADHCSVGPLPLPCDALGGSRSSADPRDRAPFGATDERFTSRRKALKTVRFHVASDDDRLSARSHRD